MPQSPEPAAWAKRLQRWRKQWEAWFGLAKRPQPERTPFPDYVACPHCGEPEVEVWCNEPIARCHNCGKEFEHRVPQECRSDQDEERKPQMRTSTSLLILVLVLAGPLLGTALAAAGLLLSPPLLGLSSLIYLALGGCVPAVVLFVTAAARRIRGVWIAVWLMFACVTMVVYLALVGPTIPSAAVYCQATAVESSRTIYHCESYNSDTGETTTFDAEVIRGLPLAWRVK